MSFLQSFMSLRENLGTVARTVFTEKNIRVLIGAFHTASTDGKTIRIPDIPGATQEEVDLIRGYIDHEGAHIMFDSFGKTGDAAKCANETRRLITENGSIAHEIINILEDVRIEYAMSQHYLGSGTNLRLMNEQLWDRSLKKYRENVDNAVDGKPGYDLDYIEWTMGMYDSMCQGQGLPAYGDKISAKAQVVSKLSRPFMYEAKNAKDIFGVLKIAERLMKTLIDKKDQIDKPNPQPGGTTQGGQGGEGQQVEVTLHPDSEGAEGEEGENGEDGADAEGGVRDGSEGPGDSNEAEVSEEGKGDRAPDEQAEDQGESTGGMSEQGEKSDAQVETPQKAPELPQSGGEETSVLDSGQQVRDEIDEIMEDLHGEGNFSHQSDPNSRVVDIQGYKTPEIPVDIPKGEKRQLWDRQPITKYMTKEMQAISGSLRGKIVQRLLTFQRGGWLRDRKSGSLDPVKSHHLALGTSDKVMRKRYRVKKPGAAVSIMLDRSGSMQSMVRNPDTCRAMMVPTPKGMVRLDRMLFASQVSIVIADMLNAGAVKTRVTGYTSHPGGFRTDKAGRIAGESKGRGNCVYLPNDDSSSDSASTCLWVSKDYEEPWNKKAMRRVYAQANYALSMSRLYSMGSTPTPRCMYEEAKRLSKRVEDRKILIVVTDGYPDNMPNYHGCSFYAMANCVNDAKKMGVDVRVIIVQQSAESLTNAMEERKCRENIQCVDKMADLGDAMMQLIEHCV